MFCAAAWRIQVTIYHECRQRARPPSRLESPKRRVHIAQPTVTARFSAAGETNPAAAAIVVMTAMWR